MKRLQCLNQDDLSVIDFFSRVTWYLKGMNKTFVQTKSKDENSTPDRKKQQKSAKENCNWNKILSCIFLKINNEEYPLNIFQRNILYTFFSVSDEKIKGE